MSPLPFEAVRLACAFYMMDGNQLNLDRVISCVVSVPLLPDKMCLPIDSAPSVKIDGEREGMGTETSRRSRSLRRLSGGPGRFYNGRGCLLERRR